MRVLPLVVTASLQCSHPVHTIVSALDQPKTVRSGQHCKGFPVAFNDFLAIQKGNNTLGFGYLPGTKRRNGRCGP